MPETVLVRSIADDQFRLMRGREIESALFVLEASTDSEAWLKQSKQISLMTLYMNRIERSVERNTKALDAMQKDRRVREAKAREEAKAMASVAWSEGRSYQHDSDGDPSGEFVFSNDDLAREVTREQSIAQATGTAKKGVAAVKPLTASQKVA